MKSSPGLPAADTELAELLGQLARELEAEDTLQDTLQAVVDAAVHTIPGADHATISFVQDERTINTPAATGELALRADALQYETGQGPGLDAVGHHEMVAVPSMADASVRWPLYAPLASTLGMNSMLSFPLFVTDDSLGALNLYSEAEYAFEEDHDDIEQIGRLFATHAAIALAGSQKVEHLKNGIRSRDLIGMAKGILMERHKVTELAAFRLLVKASQSTNRKVSDIAYELAMSGSLPQRPLPDRPSSPRAAPAVPPTGSPGRPDHG
ncbi:MAG: Response regulator receiver and domain protein [Pseudonocardiales bacterium]|nr:Response regulator receiver and domain protein [Pseudonocardiales bacterium]